MNEKGKTKWGRMVDWFMQADVFGRFSLILSCWRVRHEHVKRKGHKATFRYI